MSIETLTRLILRKMTGIGKVQSDFFVHLVLQWLRLPGRYTFENLFRQGFLRAVSYRSQKTFDLQTFNGLLIQQHCGRERIGVFAPTHPRDFARDRLSKSGKHTYGLGYFWSGCAQAVKHGLELAALSIVDIKNHTAFHYPATAGRPRQTVLAEKQTLLTFYTQLLLEQAAELRLLSDYLAVDAYFAKYEFIDTLSKSGLKVITRLRNDALSSRKL